MAAQTQPIPFNVEGKTALITGAGSGGYSHPGHMTEYALIL